MPGGSRPATPPPPPQNATPRWYRAGEWPDYSWIYWDGTGWTETMEAPDPSKIPVDGWLHMKEERETGLEGRESRTVTKSWRDPDTGLVWTRQAGVWIAVHQPSEGWEKLSPAAAQASQSAISPPVEGGLRNMLAVFGRVFGGGLGGLPGFVLAMFVILIVVLLLWATLSGGDDPLVEGTVTTAASVTTVASPETTADATEATTPAAFVDGNCNATAFTGRVLSAQTDGYALTYREIEGQLTAQVGDDCAASIHVFWVAETYYEGSDTPLCYALVGGGGGQIDDSGIFYGQHTVNAGSFAPTPGDAAQTCAALVAEGNVGQYLGQRGGEFGGVITGKRLVMNGFSTNRDKGPPLIVLDIVFEAVPNQG